MSIDGGEAQPAFSADLLRQLNEPLPRGFHEAILSPDGTAIAGHYLTDLGERIVGERIVVIPEGGGAMKRYETVPPIAAWAPDGRGLIYIDTRGGVSNLMRQTLSGGAPVPLTTFAAEQIFNFAISPDHERLALVRGLVSSDVVLVSAAKRRPTCSRRHRAPRAAAP